MLSQNFRMPEIEPQVTSDSQNAPAEYHSMEESLAASTAQGESAADGNAFAEGDLPKGLKVEVRAGRRSIVVAYEALGASADDGCF